MREIAIDLSSFEEVIEGNYIYVDKTKFVYNIATKSKYYFLSRPRRFGKSLFVNTLKTFYEGKKEFFKDLYIYDKEWEWEEYPIIKLDFNMITTTNVDDFRRNVESELKEVADKYKIKLESNKAEDIFRELVKKLSKKYKKGVVILVDEYDKPIISHIGKNPEQAKENMEFMKVFYDNLKALEEYIKTVFMTGVSKFSKVSVFSTLNNLIEIDKEPRYADIAGFTEEELYTNYSEYFEKMAKEKSLTVEELKSKFKFTYNGFRFTEGEIKVYNPFSVSRSLYNGRMDNYWFESGTPSFLMNLIKDKNYNVLDIESIEITKNELKAYDFEKLELIPLLFQTGYLTIKDIEDEIIYTLGYPNNEVKQGFTENLIKTFSDDELKLSLIHRIKKSLINEEFDSFEKYMRSLFASIANINIPKSLQERELYYHTIFYLTGVLFSDDNLHVYSELLTSEGRIDMVVETDEIIYIIEFKCNQSAKEAIEQIKEKNYSDRFKMKDKRLILLGVNFDTEKRSVGEIEVENE